MKIFGFVFFALVVIGVIGVFYAVLGAIGVSAPIVTLGIAAVGAVSLFDRLRKAIDKEVNS